MSRELELEAALCAANDELKLLRSVLVAIKEDLHVKNEQLDFLYSSVRASSEAAKQHAAQEREAFVERVRALEKLLRLSEAAPRPAASTTELTVISHATTDWTKLSPDLLLACLDFLDISSLGAALSVSRTWRLQPMPGTYKALYYHHYVPSSDILGAGSSKCLATQDWRAALQAAHSREKAWRLNKPQLTTLIGHSGTVTCLALSGDIVVSGSDDGSMILWSLKDKRRPVSVLDASSAAGDTSPKLRAAEAGASSPTTGIALMQQHHKQTREVSKVRAFHGHGGPIWALHQEHSQLLSGSYDRTIKLWELGTGRCLRSLRGHTEWVSSLARRDNIIVSGSWDATIRVWDLESGVARRSLGGTAGDAVHCLQWATTGPLVAVGSRACSVTVWDIERGDVMTSLIGHTKSVYSVNIEGPRVLSASADRLVKLWDTRCEQPCMLTLGLDGTGHQGSVMSVQNDGAFKVFSAGLDKTILIWDVRAAAQPVRSLQVHSAAVFCLSVDSTRIVSGGADNAVRITTF